MEKKILKKIKKNRGVTGIDASIAVTILMIFVPLITTIISNTINVKEKINRKVIATNLAIQAIESVKQISALDEGVISNQVVFDGKKGGHKAEFFGLYSIKSKIRQMQHINAKIN